MLAHYSLLKYYTTHDSFVLVFFFQLYAFSHTHLKLHMNVGLDFHYVGCVDYYLTITRIIQMDQLRDLEDLQDISDDLAELNKEYRFLYRKLVSIRLIEKIRVIPDQQLLDSISTGFIKASIALASDFIFAYRERKILFYHILSVYRHVLKSISSPLPIPLAYTSSIMDKKLEISTNSYSPQGMDQIISNLEMIFHFIPTPCLNTLPVPVIRYFLEKALQTPNHTKFLVLKYVVLNMLTSIPIRDDDDDKKTSDVIIPTGSGMECIKNKMQPQVSDSLPNVLLSLIFTWLTLKQVLGSCYLVNRKWRQICSLPVSYYHCDLNVDQHHIFDSIRAFVPNLFISISSLYIQENSRYVTEILEYIIEQPVQKLVSLQLQAGIALPLTLFHSLRSLNIDGIMNRIYFNCTLLEIHPTLEIISLINVCIEVEYRRLVDIQLSRKIQSLTIHTCKVFHRTLQIQIGNLIIDVNQALRLHSLHVPSQTVSGLTKHHSQLSSLSLWTLTVNNDLQSISSISALFIHGPIEINQLFPRLYRQDASHPQLYPQLDTLDLYMMDGILSVFQVLELCDALIQNNSQIWYRLGFNRASSIFKSFHYPNHKRRVIKSGGVGYLIFQKDDIILCSSIKPYPGYPSVKIELHDSTLYAVMMHQEKVAKLNASKMKQWNSTHGILLETNHSSWEQHPSNSGLIEKIEIQTIIQKEKKNGPFTAQEIYQHIEPWIKQYFTPTHQNIIES